MLVNDYPGSTWRANGFNCCNQRCRVWLIYGWRICPLCWVPQDQLGRDELVRISPATERPRLLEEFGMRRTELPLTTSQRRNMRVKAQGKIKSPAALLHERNKRRSKKAIREGYEGHTHKWEMSPAYATDSQNCVPPLTKVLEGGFP